ncbi:lysophospholipid acyltransferase family protein [Ascidiimonas sp. W6]|uniref:lysophospholipid acyltransferase family protein n=1 Tax=Ascidiimonas meishanensis TaxID=3128903 RepID=UPI0030EC6435
MKKLVAYPLSVLYFIAFGLLLVIFHAIQWFCFNVIGYQAHKKSVDVLNFFIMRCTNILGTRYSFKYSEPIPTGQPIIIVANHQSMYDIPAIIWHMRKYHPKFISKKELGKGIPSVSYNLRHGGSVLIDRKDRAKAIADLREFAKYIHKTKRAAVIFPEGTRSRDGNPKKFAVAGLKTLFEFVPDAIVVPVSINNSWKLLEYGKFPMGIGVFVKFEVHAPIPVADKTPKELLEHIEKTIKDAIHI